MVSLGLGFAMFFKRTTPAFRRCKNCPKRSSSRRTRVDAGAGATEVTNVCRFLALTGGARTASALRDEENGAPERVRFQKPDFRPRFW